MDGQTDLWKNAPSAAQIPVNQEKISAQLMTDSAITSLFDEQNALLNQSENITLPILSLRQFPSHNPLIPDQLTPVHTGASADKPCPPGVYRLLDKLRQTPANLDLHLTSPRRTSPIKGAKA
ncbi:MAG TPA: hypothetical protein PKW33_06275 [Anaerolineaceae bacterium]|nr:hypothetical protein [Anaerolineaceae bacterium]HPN51174.1 hypothetical protein [Anaerolineaceae bacterium]